jgi:hypothetical protein
LPIRVRVPGGEAPGVRWTLLALRREPSEGAAMVSM